MNGINSSTTLREQTSIMPRRMNSYSTPQRPSTSSGELVTPRSELLRQALQEKRNLPLRTASSTPRKPRGAYKSQAYQDDWIQSSEDDQKMKRRSSGTRHHTRRLTDSGVPRTTIAPSPPTTPTPGVGAKEATAEIARLEKENWDLKHRVCLQQERAQQLNEQLEAALEQLEGSRDLRERNHQLEIEKEKLKDRISRRDESIRKLKEDNKQLNEIQDELVNEMDQKDEELQRLEQEVGDRQLALEEAAGFIQQLEFKVETLQHAADKSIKPQPSQLSQPSQPSSGERQLDSDYYSADHEGDETAKVPISKPNQSKSADTPSMQDSDYFSASPNLTPSTPKDSRPQTAVNGRDEQRARARMSALSFNREIGLRSIASKDSLFGNLLESTPLPKNQSSRTLRRKSSRLRTSISESMSSSGSSTTIGSPSWSNMARPLRDLYKSGELSRGLTDDHANPLVEYTPSAGSFTSREIDDDIFSRGGTTRPNSSASTLTIQSQSQSQPQSQPQLQFLSLLGTDTPNYDRWPRKLPEWPPSAGLALRDILFHGEEERKVKTPPKPTGARSNPELLKKTLVTKAPSPLSQQTPSPTAVPPRDSSLRSSKGQK